MDQDKRNIYSVLDEWAGDAPPMDESQSKPTDKADTKEERVFESYNDETSLSEVNPDWDSTVEELVKDAIDDVEHKVEGWATATEPVESKSRPGFIPYTDGGWQGRTYSRMDSDPSYWPSPKEVHARINQTLGYAHDEAVKEMKKRYATQLKEKGLTKDDQINYTDLYDADLGDIAEALDEYERGWMEDTDLLSMIDVYYYGPENRKNEKKGGHTLYVVGAINWEAPYYRSGKGNEWVSKQFTFNFKDEGDLRSQLKRALKAIVDQMV